MTQLTRKQVNKIVKDAGIINGFTVKKNGTVVFKKSYFYTQGMTSQKFLDRIETLLTSIKAPLVAESNENRWNAWPRDSYFTATFRMV